jgi:hypothetical protein
MTAMNRFTTSTLKVAAALLLLGLTACTGPITGGNADMVEYSYVPASSATVTSDLGLEAF